LSDARAPEQVRTFDVTLHPSAGLAARAPTFMPLPLDRLIRKLQETPDGGAGHRRAWRCTFTGVVEDPSITYSIPTENVPLTATTLAHFRDQRRLLSTTQHQLSNPRPPTCRTHTARST